MELLLRLLLIFVKFVAIIVNALQSAYIWARGRRIKPYGLPANSNPLLSLSIQELRMRLCTRQVIEAIEERKVIFRKTFVSSRQLRLKWKIVFFFLHTVRL